MVLLITAERITGLQYHRQIVPFRALGLDYEIAESEDFLTDEYLKKFSIISFLREIKYPERYKALGLKIHFDIDDFWVLPASHQLQKFYIKNKIAEKTIANIKCADFVTTTTDYLANRIRQYNDNVYVLPNAIDSEDEQWKPQPTECKRTRFGYIAGVHHVREVEMLHPQLKSFYHNKFLSGQFQFLTAGFNFNQKEDGTLIANKYYRYVEQCFTDGYKALRPEYGAILATNQPLIFKDIDEPYKRLNGKDVNGYGTLYDEIDVALVPLISNEFSRCKSQLKLIEAGFKKKAVIVSNTIPYTFDARHDENAIVCNDSDWGKSIKSLIQNPNKINDLAETLFEHVNENYEIKKVNVERKQIFEKWLK